MLQELSLLYCNRIGHVGFGASWVVHRLVTMVLMICAANSAAPAQEQSFTFSPKEFITTPDTYAAPATAVMTRSQALALINATLGAEVTEKPNFYCIIHVLKWKDDGFKVDKHNWYVYHKGDSWSDLQFNGTRIFGSHNVALLFLHLNAPEANDIESFANIDYKVDVSAKLPHMIRDLAGFLFPQAQAAPQRVAYWGGGFMDIGPVPSDIKVAASITLQSSPIPAAEPKTSELATRTFDNEGKYFWDISIGVPLKGIKELSFDSALETLRPKEISRQSAFAMFNVFPMKVDTKSERARIVPVFLCGVALAERPLDRMVFAGGIGINKVQIFFGTAYTNKQFPGETLGETFTKRRTNFIWGVNVPLRQAIQLIKKPK